MRISIFGLGYVGSVCAACLASRGHTVIGVDNSVLKVELLRSGRSSLVEFDVSELIKQTVVAGRLTATTDAAEAISSTDATMICVGTPNYSNGSQNLEALRDVATEIGRAIGSKAGCHLVLIRSTVLPGTTRETLIPCLANASGKAPGRGLDVVFSPEFLRTGSGVSDFMGPTRTIVGAMDLKTAESAMLLFSDFPGAKICTDLETAELLKYADNSWHALKITFANEIGLLAKALAIDGRQVMKILSKDKRLNISDAYLRPGFAFGGSCLRKDLDALIDLSHRLGSPLPVISQIRYSNQFLLDYGISWTIERCATRVALLGISFKAGTDDTRDSPFVMLAKRLIDTGHQVRILDAGIHIEGMTETNREFLMRNLPDWRKLLTSDLDDLMAWAETVVVTSPDPAYVAALSSLRNDQVVLDLTSQDIDTTTQLKVFRPLS